MSHKRHMIIHHRQRGIRKITEHIDRHYENNTMVIIGGGDDRFGTIRKDEGTEYVLALCFPYIDVSEDGIVAVDLENIRDFAVVVSDFMDVDTLMVWSIQALRSSMDTSLWTATQTWETAF